jgi:proteasome assembly chaperone 2
MPFFYPTNNFKLTGKTLIVPLVSTANVSQLAVDLLIASLSLKRIGIFDPRDLVPVVGGREDGGDGVTTPLELYGRDGVDVVVIQQRSPAMKSRKQEFTESLLNFIHSSNFAACVFLSGVDMSNRTDAQMLTPTYYIHPPNTPSLASSPLSALTQLPIPVYTSPVLQHPQATTNEGSIPFIPGGGLTRRFLSSLPSAWTIPTVSLLQFVVEGDNRADANLLAVVTAKVLAVDQFIREWKQPTSWKQGLFGTVHDQSLYG